jgi:hypothetical protein
VSVLCPCFEIMKQLIVLTSCCQFAVAALVMNLATPFARAQEPSSVNLPTILSVSTNLTLTLDALVAEALEKNPELNFYKAEIAASGCARPSPIVILNWRNLATSVSK